MPKKPRTNSAHQAAIQKRRADAIELRLAGLDNVSIGRKLAADPAINMDGLGYPHGYGIERYEDGREPPADEDLSRLVSEDLRRALKERVRRVDMVVDDLRDLEVARLDRVFLVAWRQALSGDLQAIDRVLRIQERRARLLGLDAAMSMRVAGANGGPVEIDVAGLEQKIAEVLGEASDSARMAPPAETALD